MTGIMTTVVGGLGSGGLDTQTVTVGIISIFGGVTYYGFVTSSIGSISDGTFNLENGAPIISFYYSSLGSVLFTISGAYPNSGWNQVSIDGNIYLRSSATYSSSTNTSWAWTSATNPFGTTSGATVKCVFT